MNQQNGGGPGKLPRRSLLGLGAVSTASMLMGGCDREGRMEALPGVAMASEPAGGSKDNPARLRARPRPSTEAITPGERPLGLRKERDGLLYVPAGYRADKPAPLVVTLHGAGGHAGHGLGILRHLADESGLILLAPASRASSWDIISDDSFGPDVAFIDRALAYTFARCAVDPARVAVGGFSDGASYALSIGVSNGDLFRHILAFSPGYMAPGGLEGRPRVFVSHGTGDQVLPIERCSRRVVPALRRAGYDVRYREFDGPHTVPAEMSRDALAWFLSGGA